MKNHIRIINQVGRTYSHLCQTVMQKYNITKCELDILLFLYNNPDLDTAKDIVEKRGIVKSHASMGIEKLIQKQYLETLRDEKDKRKYHLHLLKKANPIIKDGLKVQEEFNYQMFQGISEKDEKTFHHVLEQIYQNLKEDK